MPTAIVLDIKCWSADDTSRQSLLSVSPSYTSDIFARQSLSLAADDDVTITCGKRYIFLVSTSPVIYSLDDSDIEMTGSLIMLTFDDESHTLHITATVDTKIIYVSVD